MNGARYEGGETAEARLAAVVMELLHSIDQRNLRQQRNDMVDYADITAAIRPYVQKELLHARIEEIRESRNEARNRLVAREATLHQELARLEGEIVAGRTSGSGAKAP